MAEALRRDVARNLERPATPWRILASIAWSRGVQAALLYRLAHRLWQQRLRLMSEILRRLSQLLYGVDIAYEAEIGPGLVLRHPHDIVIGFGARIGEDVTIYNGVTVGLRLSGSRTRRDGMPEVGDRVTLATGAKVLGPITVGPGSIVGANAVLTQSVPPKCRISAPAPRISEH